MIKLYDDNKFEAANQKDKFPLKCKNCGITFYRTKEYIKSILRGNRNATIDFCSRKCSREFKGRTTVKSFCDFCKNPITRVASEYNKRRYHFCSVKCRFDFGRTYFTCDNCGQLIQRVNCKYEGYRHHFCSVKCNLQFYQKNGYPGSHKRSKLELWIEKMLISLYPNLEFKFNDRMTIKSELDIYIPSLNLAFELNGPCHYEPIFGKDKLEKTQDNDHRKFQLCIENKIDLCVIDTSYPKYFKIKSSTKYLNMIVEIINSRL